ncbi:MAG: LysR family transcriptional regulator, partial [Polyangiales bacterium]
MSTKRSPVTPRAENLDDYGYFAAVVEHGGFASAGRALGVPKSKLSRRIAQLETRLGVRLLNRTTRRFALTAMGDAVLQHARAMLIEAEAAEALVNEETSEPRGKVRLSCPPALLHAAVGNMLARFLNAWPKIELHVEATNQNVDVWRDAVDISIRVRDPSLPLLAEEIVRPLAL